MNGNAKSKKYLVAFFITAAIFGTAFFVSDYFNDKRIESIQSIQEQISIDILSLETQFDLLQESSCDAISENSVLSQELNSLARRLAYTEGSLGSDNEEVVRLKRQYSLLEIKDYLLMKEISRKCGLDPVFVLYFYSNEGDCDECGRMGHVLTYLREQYPKLRVYSFDYHLELAALETLTRVNNIEPALPAVVVNDVTHYGFQSVEKMEEILPRLDELRDEEETATSTEEEK